MQLILIQYYTIIHILSQVNVYQNKVKLSANYIIYQTRQMIFCFVKTIRDAQQHYKVMMLSLLPPW